MRAKKKDNKNLSLGLFFCLVLGLLILISFLFKVYFSIKNSKYNSNLPFVLTEKSAGEWRTFEVISGNTLNVLTLKGSSDALENLSVPTDIAIDKDLSSSNLKDEFLSVALSSSNLTLFDKIRIFILVHTLADQDIHERNLTLINSAAQDLQALGNFLNDDSISKENLSVQVINATGEALIASKFARELENLGINVVLANTSTKVEDKSSIKTSVQNNIVVSVIERKLGIKADGGGGTGVADVIITIGKESLSKF